MADGMQTRYRAHEESIASIRQEMREHAERLSSLEQLPQTCGELQQSVSELRSEIRQVLVRFERQTSPSPSKINQSLHRSTQPPLPFEISPSRSPFPSITASSSHLRLPSTEISYSCSHPRSSAKSEAFTELEVAERQHTSGTFLSIFPKAFTEIAHPLSQDENQPLTASATVPLHPPTLTQTTIATDTSTTPQISQFINEILPSIVASPTVTVHPPSLPQSQPHTSIPTSLKTSPTPPDATTLLHLPIPQPAMASIAASVQPQAYHLSNSTSTIVPFQKFLTETPQSLHRIERKHQLTSHFQASTPVDSHPPPKSKSESVFVSEQNTGSAELVENASSVRPVESVTTIVSVDLWICRFVDLRALSSELVLGKTLILASAQTQPGLNKFIRALVPLKNDLEEDHSTLRFPVFEGDNVLGRHIIPVTDKRLSRKHLSVSASADGSADLIVEGMNPIVLRFSGQRMKVSLREKVTINNGEIVELIPGQYIFKYVTLIDENYPALSYKEKADYNKVKNAGFSKKRPRPEYEQKSRMRGLQVEPKNKSSLQATSSVSIEAVIQGNALVAILSNYMVDMDWLLSACPKLSKVPHVLVVHGESDVTREYMKRTKPANWIWHKPPLPISYGTPHSNAMLLVCPQGGPEFTSNLPSLGSFKINSSFFKKFDYGNAEVRLIASVPRYHSGSNLKKWGHMKHRFVLEQCNFNEECPKFPLVYQFSSLGSVDEKWMAELKSLMSSGSLEDKTPLGLGEPLIIWPTVEDVRYSLEGYAAGNAIPSPLKNVEKELLKKYWAKWKASHTGRCGAMPHIKTYNRYNGLGISADDSFLWDPGKY